MNCRLQNERSEPNGTVLAVQFQFRRRKAQEGGGTGNNSLQILGCRKSFFKNTKFEAANPPFGGNLGTILKL